MYDLPTTSRYVPAKRTGGLLKDLPSDLDGNISHLLDSLWCNMVYGTRHDVQDQVF